MPVEGGSGRDARFRKSDRLRKRWEYLAVQRRGRKIHLQDLLVIILPRQGDRRMGITVSSKVGEGTTFRIYLKKQLEKKEEADS